MIAAAVAALSVALFLSATSIRRGLLISVLAGFLQDPIRKLVPGEPVYLTVLVGLFVAATVLGAAARGVPMSFRPIHAWDPRLRLPLRLFGALVLLQAVAAFARSGSLVIPAIGVLSYLAPLPAILMAYHFARTERDVVRFAEIYLAAAALMATGIYLSYLGFEWPALAAVGEGLIAFSPGGEQLPLLAGFFRAPEIAAWHIATAVCLLLLLMVVSGRSAPQLWMVAVGVLLLGALLLTGRRKAIVEILIFLAAFIFLLAFFRKGALRLTGAFAAAVVLAVGGYELFVPEQVTTGMVGYYERGVRVDEEAPGRLATMTVHSLGWVIERNGVLGSGAGMGSQGAQHFGGGVAVVGYAAEGGLGKILAELGIPGLLVIAWLGIALLGYLWRVMLAVRRGLPARAQLAYGLAALLAANAAVYVAAHQVFGDLFVLLLLGWMIGFLLAVPRMPQPWPAPDVLPPPGGLPRARPGVGG